MASRLLAAMLLLAAGGAFSRAQPIQGDIRAVGFRTPGQTGFVLREGQWFPILVELNAASSEHQEVVLRCECPDLDGDRVAYLSERVTLTGGGPSRSVWCYAVSLSGRSWQATLDVLSGDGVLITRFDLPPFELISNDEMLILDISARPVTELRAVGGQPGLPDRRYYRGIVVGQMPAAELPDRWWGLEAVDVIVWDEPSFDPKTISPNQLEALIDWVRNGGELVVGIGASWPRIQKSRLAEIIPLRGDTPPVTTRVLPRFLASLAGDVEEFEAPISVAIAQPTAGALPTFTDRLPTGQSVNLIVTDLVGSGRVTAVAASLRDLNSVKPRLIPPAGTRALFLKLFDLNPNTKAFLESEVRSSIGLMASRKPYGELTKPIEFQRRAGLLMLAAAAFVTIYIGLSTLASWGWLRRRGLTRLSWTVFAAFAVLASVVSVGAVALSRGVFGRVDAVSLIDLEGGSSQARAMCLFGYRSPRRQRVDLSLPGEGNYLRPLTPVPEDPSQYATPERYTAVTREALLRDTLMRATLKQFEGFWQGQLDGTVRAQLVADRQRGMLTENSWIQNDLDVDLTGGYLLYLDPRLVRRDDTVDRAAGHTSAYRPDYRGGGPVPPAINVLAVRLPPIKAGQQIRQLGAREYAAYERAWDGPRGWNARQNRDSSKEPDDLVTLWHCQQQWAGDLSPALGFSKSGFDETAVAGFLAATRAFYLHNSSSSSKFESCGTPLTTNGLVDRDISHWLLREQAVLLLMADDPGPAVLHGDGKPMDSKHGRSLYRVRVPIRYGHVQRGTTP
jgi:hypothetical protein